MQIDEIEDARKNRALKKFATVVVSGGGRGIRRASTEVILPGIKDNNNLQSRKRQAVNLPPADMLFDHIDRISTKLEQIKEGSFSSVKEESAEDPRIEIVD